ncbi:MAG: hypothetical protein ACTSX7_19080 [Alphaproteobacteria bacterium]
MSAPDFIFEASTKPSLPWHEVPLIRASDASVEGYGRLVDDPESCEIEIVRWPASGWRPVDDDSGDEGGWVEGIFTGRWTGDVLCGTNDAVNGDYVLGWSTDPQQASAHAATRPRWRATRCCYGT